MKKIFITAFLIMFSAASAYASDYGNVRAKAPRVEYTSPMNQSVVDLAGKGSLRFEWKQVPIPAGGRVSYRFVLYRGFGYDVVVKETLDAGVFFIEIPSEKFEDGRVYTWHVQQRDGRSMEWSIFTNWSFKVVKKADSK